MCAQAGTGARLPGVGTGARLPGGVLSRRLGRVLSRRQARLGGGDGGR
jgi:hypothetical protein